jgi:anti-sigma regulatory factor (Ser/Thr protein kinase)
MNVIQHGRPESPQGAIRLSLRLEGGEIVATVADRGAPFNPLLAPEPDLSAGLEQRNLGGLGIHLVRRLVSGMEYERREGHNRLTLRKRHGADPLRRRRLAGRPASAEGRPRDRRRR